jgi:hypothetical protein
MSFKAEQLLNSLGDELKKSARALVQTRSVDGNGDHVLTLSEDATPAAGEKVIVIRSKAIDWPLSKDVLGLPSVMFTPHVIQICTEANYEGADDTVLDILGPAELLPVLLTVGKRGTKVEWYVSANGDVPSTAEMTAANLAAEYHAELYHGMQASQ